MRSTLGVIAMGTWLATVRFPGGGVRYAQYSTVVGSVFDQLYAAACFEGGTLPDGSRCYRGTVVGEPDGHDRSAPVSVPKELVLVGIETEPDGTRWHALYCPRRAMILGPASSYHQQRLREEFELFREEDGQRHLSRDGGDRTICGRRVDGTASDEEDVDLYAGWGRSDLCQECLVAVAQ
ncbi:hypothetical protein M1L60_42295 [Actinoplanes sp. TRM 88003]|uniref:Uncharacterized protein n=1 Tax=Paractinoplanes aksuensis TaxID=2939490 RepID=A0ABT1E276_9ACTN|nr:hypothetical protein [Actinoplanes aksuensis]MCO8277227.1 hypothetical protein [Actinoplanes aksuensis]